MNLDERINDLAGSHSIGYYGRDSEGSFIPVDPVALARLLDKDIKQLIREVVAAVTPERKDEQMAVRANSLAWFSRMEAHNCAIDQLEANAKRLGL